MPTFYLKKWILVFITCAACLITIRFILTGWNEYQSKQDYLKAKSLISSGQNVDEGLALLKNILPHLSKDVYFLEDYGRILAGLGRNEEAIEIYELALQAGYFPSILESMASLYLKTGQYSKAIDYAEKALCVLPWKLGPMFQLASAYLEEGDKEQAFKYALDTILTPMKVPTNRGMKLKHQAREILKVGISEVFHGEVTRSVFSGMDDEILVNRLKSALWVAGENRPEMEKALLEIPPERLEYLIFLLVNMPESDLRSLDSSYLLDNIDYALRVRNIWSFRPDLPEDIFLNYLLPYAQIGEARDSWREEFMKSFLPIVEECNSAGEILLSLQSWIPNLLGLQFDYENKSDSFWSVGETVKNKLGNCISFSILLADACRAVGVPARVVVIPQWVGLSAGHAWVEIYDQGQWKHISAFDPGPLNRTWFEERAATTDTSKFKNRIYAASFKRTGTQILQYGPNNWWTDETGNYVK